MPSLVGQHPDLEDRLGTDDTAARQRARLLEAVSRTVAEKGYAAATVTDIVRAAGVSRSTFYALFASKEECFVEAYRHGAEVALHRMRDAARAVRGQGWREEMRAGVRAYLETLAAEPRFTRTSFVEIHAVGPAALAARDEALRRFADRFTSSLAHAHAEGDAADAELPAELTVVLAAGLDQLVAEQVRAGRTEELRELEPIFMQCAEAVLAPRSTPTTTGG